MSLASRLPYDHPYAGGFSGIGSQSLPTDSDCLTYLSAVAAADGAGVEVGVAVAVDAFFKALKATPGLFDAIKASCILCGARTITGALVPLAGAAPTAQGGWASEDYSRTAGLVGDGVALYLDTNVANNSDFSGTVADPQDDNHNAIYITTAGSTTDERYMGAESSGAGTNCFGRATNSLFRRNRSGTSTIAGDGLATGLIGMSRSDSASYVFRSSGTNVTSVTASETPTSTNIYVFRFNNTAQISDTTIAFYSIGTSVDLEALDTAVDNLISAIGEAL